MPLLIAWSKTPDGISAVHGSRAALVGRPGNGQTIFRWKVEETGRKLYEGAEPTLAAARRAAEKAIKEPGLRPLWTVTRDGATRRNGPRLVMSGFEEDARARYAKEAAALRQGDVRLIGPDGTVVERAWAPRLRIRW